ncbi:biotin synthase BioB [Candidatus Saganbacteria bacterium]|nr:biotin synthase BioB [Candidatus Saganbacteria bacterium]
MTLSFKEAINLINSSDEETFSLLAKADETRRKFKGNKVKLCAIVNAKSGRCSENCSFCAQSGHFSTKTPIYPLLSKDEMFKSATDSEKNFHATCFSIVTAGKSVKTDQEIEDIAGVLSAIKSQTKLDRCVSLGTLSKEQIKKLKAAGLKRLHHNLETAESFFNQVCTTHTYQERLATIKAAKAEGLEVCSGGIFGLGETPEQRVELAFTLAELKVDSVPINILNPIPGTPAAKNYRPMPPLEVLRLVAVYRLILQDKDIGVFGGRELSLGTLQPLMFLAGANVTLIGDYLTTKGQAPEKDLRMLADLGLEVDTPSVPRQSSGPLPLAKGEKERG